MAQQVARKPKAPLRHNTRQRVYTVGDTDIQLGSQRTVQMYRTGMLSGILFTVKATATFSATGVLADMGPFNLISRIRVILNTGTQDLFNLSGYETFYANWQMLRGCFFPGATDVAVAATASGANSWEWTLYVPIAMNNQLQFGLGLIQLQVIDTICTVEIQFTGLPTDVATNCTAITGSVSFTQLAFETPDFNFVEEPPAMLHRFYSDRQPILQDGDQLYYVPRGGDILQLAHILTLNGSIADLRLGPSGGKILSARLIINESDKPYEWTASALRYWIAFNHGAGGVNQATWSVGTGVLHNFMDAGVTQLGEGDGRDWINSDTVSTLKSVVTIAPGSVSGTANYLDSIRRFFQEMN